MEAASRMGARGKNAHTNNSRNTRVLLAKRADDVSTRFMDRTPLPRGRGSVTAGFG
jgi:hypothetical protein